MLVMPAFTWDNSDPADWSRPSVPEAWRPILRAQTPAFDPAVTPTPLMGASPRLPHLAGNRPQRASAVSFSAWARDAQAVTANHGLTSHLGKTSPLARVYEHDGWVLLLDAGHRSRTSFHLGYYRAGYGPEEEIGAALTAKKLAWPFRLTRETDVVLGAGIRRQTVRVSFCEEGA